MNAHQLQQLISAAVQYGVSDIHLRVGSVPIFRKQGNMVALKMAPLTAQDFADFCRLVINDPAVTQSLSGLRDFDGSYAIPQLCRFRYNIFRHMGDLGAVLRIIPAKIPTIEAMGLPSVLKTLAEKERGMILVTGATGSGKSSTLAAMINHINAHHPLHILTIEDPIEFVHPQRMSRVTQREVGRDTTTFAAALRSALRQDPDIILVGEMRDTETMDIALKAAETGHLVFSTVHTTDAIKTVGRLVAMFPPEEQRMVRLRLSDNLVGTVSQRLLESADGKGRVAAQEIMVVNTAIRECIADEKRTGEINEFIQNGRDTVGSQTFDQHITDLYLDGKISLETAKGGATNAADFERNLKFSSTSDRGGPTGSSQVQARAAAAAAAEPQIQLDRPETTATTDLPAPPKKAA